LHHLSNNDFMLRQLLGISDLFGKEPFIFEYQNIYDNVSKLSDAMLVEINVVIVDFGHKNVFKKKEPLHCTYLYCLYCAKHTCVRSTR